MKFDFKLSQISHKTILLFLFLIRLPLMFIPMNYGDSILFYRYGQFFFNNHLPYRDYMLLDYSAEGFMRFNPPMYYVTMFLLMFISGNIFEVSLYITKLVYNLFDFGVMYVMYRLFEEYISEDGRKIMLILYGFSPSAIIIQGVLGAEESITQFFGLLGLLYLQQKKYGKAGLFFGLGIAQKLMPMFYFIVLFPLFVKKQEYINLGKMIGCIILVYVFFSIPYFFGSFPEYIAAHLDILNRVSSITLFPPNIDNELSDTIFIIPIIKFGISMKLIIQLIFLIPFFIYIVKQQASFKRIFEKIYLVFLFLPIFTLSNHLRYAYWLTPFILYHFMKNRSINYEDEIIGKNLKVFSIFITIFSIIILIIHYSYWGIYLNDEAKYTQMRSIMIVLLIYLPIWIYCNFSFPLENYITRTFILMLTFLYSAFVITFSSDLYMTPIWSKYIGIGFAFVNIFIGIYLIKEYKKSFLNERLIS